MCSFLNSRHGCINRINRYYVKVTDVVSDTSVTTSKHNVSNNVKNLNVFIAESGIRYIYVSNKVINPLHRAPPQCAGGIFERVCEYLSLYTKHA